MNRRGFITGIAAVFAGASAAAKPLAMTPAAIQPEKFLGHIDKVEKTYARMTHDGTDAEIQYCGGDQWSAADIARMKHTDALAKWTANRLDQAIIRSMK